MTNILDQFIEIGNVAAEPIIGDTFSWDGSEYIGTVSDLLQEEFFEDNAAGTRKDAERLLEAALSVFPAGTRPRIHDRITFAGETYKITKVESLDTTNVVYRIRIPLAPA